jgi:protein O-mannosyl-transferase
MARKKGFPKSAASAPPKTAAVSVSGKFEKLIPAILLVAGIVVYSNSLHAPFIFDDRYHILDNARIRQLWPPGQYLFASSRPVVYFSLALNYAISGLDPWSYHALNILIHILAALILYGVARRTFLSAPLQQSWGASAPWLAGLIAALWLVHPLETESVTYTIQRGESLNGLFYLLTLYCVIRMSESPKRALWMAAAVASCLCGMGSKGGVMITAPLVIFLYDRAFLSASWKDAIRQRGAVYAALAATWLSYPFLLAAAPEEWQASAGFSYTSAGPAAYAMTQPAVILHYIHLAFLPDQLCLDYGWPLAHSIAEVWFPCLLVLGLVGATVWAWRISPPLGFLGASFFIILIPTSSFIPIADVEVDHRMYLSLASVIAMMVVGGAVLARRNPGWGKIEFAAGVLIAFVLGGATLARNLDYASKVAIWQDAIRKSPNNPRAHYDLGVALEETGDIPGAIAQYQVALAENPEYVDALNNLGYVLAMAGKADDAVGYFRHALKIKPDLAEAHNNLGHALAQLGNIAEARAEWRESLRFRPGYASPHNNLGMALVQEGNVQGAMTEWEQAIALDPDFAEAQNNLAYALSEQGRAKEAIAHYERAVRSTPPNFQAFYNFSRLLAAQGSDPVRAVTLARIACDLPGHRDAACLSSLAAAYAAANRFEDAIQTAQAALQLAQTSGQAQLGNQITANLDVYRKKR